MIKQKIKNHKIFSLLIVGFLRYSGYSKECIAAVLLSQNESESCLVMSDSLLPHGLYSPWNSPGQNTEVGSLSLSRGSSQPRNQTQFSRIAGKLFTGWATTFPDSSVGKESACNAGDWVRSLGWEDPLEKGKATHFSILENSMDCIVHGVAKSWTWLSDFHFH